MPKPCSVINSDGLNEGGLQKGFAKWLNTYVYNLSSIEYFLHIQVISHHLQMVNTAEDTLAWAMMCVCPKWL